MDYLGLTTTEQIRSVLTVSDENLPDEVVDGFGLQDDLTVELLDQLPNWADVLADTTKPANQARLRMFGKYFCAGTLGFTAQVFVLKKATDGNNEGQRSDKDGWGFIAQGFLTKAQGYMDEILEDLGLAPELTPTSVIGRVIPDRDPITQARS